jgi:DNA methylase
MVSSVDDRAYLSVHPTVADRLREATLDISPVSGLTHNFYRYPARFSPRFARQAIEVLTAPGDLVVDPFMGGGTTLVEASALGRYAIGTDISTLAAFVARVKTTLYSENDLRRLEAWIGAAQGHINMHRTAVYPADWAERGYLRHIESPKTWRLAKSTRQAIASAVGLSDPRLENLARCMVLRTAQWALDARKKIPSVDEFRRHLTGSARGMLVGAKRYREAVEAAFGTKGSFEPLCLNVAAHQLDTDPVLRTSLRPKLILTSPPYPGVHVLYHRWQIDGRKETPAPFWIANQLDGSGARYYMLGDHRECRLRRYYDNLLASFLSIRRFCSSDTIVVQLVAFAAPDWQLPEYLRVMRRARFSEVILPLCGDTTDGRIWRKVPNRRWHARQLGETSSSTEVVLIHTPSPMLPLRHSPRDTPNPRPAH